LILLCLLPIFLFSELDPLIEFNPLVQGSLQMQFITQHELQSNSTYRLFEIENVIISKALPTDFETFTPAGEFPIEQIQRVIINPFSESFWTISPPAFNHLLEQLNNDRFKFRLSFKFDFLRQSSSTPNVDYTNEIELTME
jgi:hypothetical protein